VANGFKSALATNAGVVCGQGDATRACLVSDVSVVEPTTRRAFSVTYEILVSGPSSSDAIKSLDAYMASRQFVTDLKQAGLSSLQSIAVVHPLHPGAPGPAPSPSPEPMSRIWMFILIGCVVVILLILCYVWWLWWWRDKKSLGDIFTPRRGKRTQEGDEEDPDYEDRDSYIHLEDDVGSEASYTHFYS